MRVGISLSSSHRFPDVREGAREMVRRARAASDAGLDSLFVGDHHVTPGPYYQNVAILGRLLAEWGDRPAGALFLLPLWHPVLLAEQIGTLASIASGRFIMQCAVGPDDEQFPGMGVSAGQRPSRFEQSLDIVRRLWAGETVSHDGRWRFEGAHIAPTPPGPVEVWVGGTADAAIERAARLGDGWLAAPGLGGEEARFQVRRYLEAREREGQPPAAVAIRRDIYVGESDTEAEAAVRPLLERGYRGFPEDALVFGSAQTVIDRFAELGALGYTDVIVRNMLPDTEHAVGTIERLASVRQALTSL
ncbi:MAG: LLM class flavin-dependent oxidoreductase [Dehalococcoidia bacterium]|nr:LLM class flavin-dependent oxidoreductase [Dehalococcoidia bacterium]